MVITKLYNEIKLYNEDAGVIYKFDNLKQFCEDMDLPFRAMYHLVKGRTQKSNGFILL